MLKVHLFKLTSSFMGTLGGLNSSWYVLPLGLCSNLPQRKPIEMVKKWFLPFSNVPGTKLGQLLKKGTIFFLSLCLFVSMLYSDIP